MDYVITINKYIPRNSTISVGVDNPIPLTGVSLHKTPDKKGK